MNSSTTIRLSRLDLTGQDAQVESLRAEPKIREAELSDEVLLVRVGEGSGEALSVLFHRYARLVRAVAVRILHDGPEADDLVQEIFLFIHRKSRRFDNAKSSARSWIVQMSYHRAIDRRRYLNSRHFYTRLDLSQTMDLSDRCSAEMEGPESFAYMVGNTTISAVFDTLTDDQRNTLSLHFVEGFTFAEIAEKLDQSVGNVRNHYYRGLEKLRRQMFPAGLPSRNGNGKK